MIKKGLEILRPREKGLEKMKAEISLPLEYELFTRLYELGEDGLRFVKFYHNRNEIERGLRALICSSFN